jgi:hypothetical protein
MANGIFIAENMASTKLSSLLKSVRYMAGGVAAAIQNGRLVTLGALEANQKEIYVAGDVAAATDPIYIIDTPEVIYSQETTSGLNDFINAAGALSRARKPAVGDKFAVRGNAITALGAAPVVGNSVVTPAAGNMWAESAAPAGTESFIGVIRESFVLGNDPLGGGNITMYSIEATRVV